jgi:hypothetical protein
MVPAQQGKLRSGAFVAHPHVVDDPLGLLVAAPQFLLLAAVAGRPRGW